MHQPAGLLHDYWPGSYCWLCPASVRSGFCEAGLAEISTLVDEAEDKLFHKILSDTNHVLFQLFPDQRGELTYSLRKRPHDRPLTQRTSRLSDCKFITRKLSQDSY